MADEGHGETHFARQVLEQIERHGLGGNIKTGDDLVGQHEIRLQQGSPRNADALALAARQLMRAAMQNGGRQRDALQHGAGRRFRRAAIRHDAVQQQGLGQDAADGVARIERGHRILKDHLHAPPERPHGTGREIGDRLAIETERTGRGRHEAQQCAAQRRLAGPAFADDADDLAAADRDVDAVQHLHAGARLAEQAGAAIGDLDAARLDQGSMLSIAHLSRVPPCRSPAATAGKCPRARDAAPHPACRSAGRRRSARGYRRAAGAGASLPCCRTR